MADEPDGINETFQSSARVALTAAGLIAERMARARQQAQHDAQAASQQDARELQLRVDMDHPGFDGDWVIRFPASSRNRREEERFNGTGERIFVGLELGGWDVSEA